MVTNLVTNLSTLLPVQILIKTADLIRHQTEEKIFVNNTTVNICLSNLVLDGMFSDHWLGDPPYSDRHNGSLIGGSPHPYVSSGYINTKPKGLGNGHYYAGPWPLSR